MQLRVEMLARYFVRLNPSIQIFRSVAAPVFGEIERLVGLGDPVVDRKLAGTVAGPRLMATKGYGQLQPGIAECEFSGLDYLPQPLTEKIEVIPAYFSPRQDNKFLAAISCKDVLGPFLER